MGNCAVIKIKNMNVGIYLHWNGGRDSVEAFLEYCKIVGIIKPGGNKQNAFAGLSNVISNFLGNDGYVGIDVIDRLPCDNHDNGVYVIGDNWEIIERKYFSGEEQKEHELEDMLNQINEKQTLDFKQKFIKSS